MGTLVPPLVTRIFMWLRSLWSSNGKYSMDWWWSKGTITPTGYVTGMALEELPSKRTEKTPVILPMQYQWHLRHQNWTGRPFSVESSTIHLPAWMLENSLEVAFLKAEVAAWRRRW